MSSVKIAYERNLTGSYMVISAPEYTDMDEKLMLRRKLPGLLPVEKAYVNGGGQYWYNISGKQSLDCYCRVQEIGMEFIERMIVSICNEMELLEWNLIQTRCLMLDPDLVFITNGNREFIFTVYPEPEGCVEGSFRELMEYLLTKVDHKNAQAVHASYGIYEKTLEEGFSITEIRDCIMKAKKEQVTVTEDKAELSEEVVSEPVIELPVRQEKRSIFEHLKEWVINKLVEYGLVKPKKKKESKKKKQEGPVYPEDVPVPMPQPKIRPTVCLGTCQSKPHGLLVYQGNEQMEDIYLEAKESRIGYGDNVEIRINRDTVSQIHARIEKEEDIYYIEDLNSTNGTFVNDEPLAYKERRKLNRNDIVCFADIRYRFS